MQLLNYSASLSFCQGFLFSLEDEWLKQVTSENLVSSPRSVVPRQRWKVMVPGNWPWDWWWMFWPVWLSLEGYNSLYLPPVNEVFCLSLSAQGTSAIESCHCWLIWQTSHIHLMLSSSRTSLCHTWMVFVRCASIRWWKRLALFSTIVILGTPRLAWMVHGCHPFLPSDFVHWCLLLYYWQCVEVLDLFCLKVWLDGFNPLPLNMLISIKIWRVCLQNWIEFASSFA